MYTVGMRFTVLTKFQKADLKPGEHIMLRVKRHWMSFAISMIRPIFIFMMILGAAGVLLWEKVLFI